MELRKYQIELIEKTRSLLRAGKKSVLIQAPTGSGKTALTAYMLGRSSSKGVRSWFIVHRRELIKQSCETFHRAGVQNGIIAAGFDFDSNKLVHVCGVQTLLRRMDRFERPKLIVWDECHHLAAKTWKIIYEKYSDATHIGLSATPIRLDGKGLCDWFKDIVCGPSVSELINQGWLSPFKIYAPKTPDLNGVHHLAGDFNKKEIENVMNKPTVTGDAIKEYVKLANGKRAILRTVSIQHSMSVAEQFKLAGIPAKHIDGDTPSEERDSAMSAFRRGEILVICFVDLFSEGLDIPGIEAAFDLRPTESLVLWMQFCGRALRPLEGKKVAIICDLAGNVFRHGLPDEPRDWTLEGRDKKKGSKSTVRLCPSCFAAQPIFRTSCQFCGFTFPVIPREIAHQEGELVEVNSDMVRRQMKREQGRAQSMEELIALAKARNYKHPYSWAGFVFRARQARSIQGAK